MGLTTALLDRVGEPHGEFPPFRPRPPWLGPDLQTMRNFIVRPRADLSSWPATSLDLPMGDGTGDRLCAEWHRNATRRPMVVLIHGLTGCADSYYIILTARSLLTAGFSVLRLNLRGAGATRAYCRERYHAGRTQDLADALAALPKEARARGVLAVGFSLGANLLLNLLGGGGGEAIAAAAAVSAPIELRAASLAMKRPRNRVYQSYLLRRMKAEAFGSRTVYDPKRRRAIASARTVYEYDDTVVAPLNGFSGADDYYARCSSRRLLDDIATPTLVIHALDDPWIPGDDYARHDWRRNCRLTALLPPRGGHVGFHGLGGSAPWHDRCIVRFFERFAATT
ncbi:MAG TPA: alpha/beta fold hydrolase [Alphaproteobacteria bacterium]|nr:alpha/beta fold hydrolase [Alphaproteobacteria bacterium]